MEREKEGEEKEKRKKIFVILVYFRNSFSKEQWAWESTDEIF